MITALTQNNGLMEVYARGIRKEGAKMRGNAKPYARVSVSVILGKNNILKDITITDTLDAVWNNEVKYTALVHLLRLIRTYIPVTESHDAEIFTTIETAAQMLKETEPKNAENILLIAQVMLLSALGYVDDQTITPARFPNMLTKITTEPHYRKTIKQHLKDALYHQ